MQRDSNGLLHPISFILATLNPAKQNYNIYDRELLALIQGLEEWRHYLEGLLFLVIAWVDHQNFTFFRQAQRLNRWQARWLLYVSRFNLKLTHIAGKEMTVPDALSRQNDFDTSQDNEDVTLLPKKMFARIEVENDSNYKNQIVEAMNDAERTDPYLTKVWEDLKAGKKSHPPHFSIDNGLLRYKDRLYIPAGPLRRRLLREKHDHLTTGHPGRFATMAALIEYWWPSMSVFVKNYVSGCSCQQHKVNTHPTVPPLDLITSKVTRLFSQISVDFVTDLPNKGGHDSLMV